MYAVSLQKFLRPDFRSYGRILISAVFHQYIELSAYLHPFFRAMIPVTILHPPLMSTKLVNATAWDDINGPNPEISALTLFQRDIAENMVLDSIAEATGPNADSANSDVTLISLLSLLSFEVRL